MTITLDGTAGMTAPVGAVYNGIQSSTAVASTSGTAIPFTGIPLWAKRVTVIFNSVSTNGASLIQVQIGSGTIQTTGYVSSATSATATPVVGSSTTGFVILGQGTSAASISGQMVLIPVSGNIWTAAFSGFGQSATPVVGGGVVTLSGALDRLTMTTVNGTDTFDAGSINILYE